MMLSDTGGPIVKVAGNFYSERIVTYAMRNQQKNGIMPNLKQNVGALVVYAKPTGILMFTILMDSKFHYRAL